MATRSKLAVILHADVVDSTTLVRIDERVAHERMQDAFQRLSAAIASYGGTTHELRGDALVAEFARASDAVSAALAFQVGNRAHNEKLDGEIRPEVRTGLALGEVVVADRTVTGTGVVLAQRLEQLAQPGGTVIQGSIYESVPRRFPFAYQNLGELNLKGFDEPTRAYAVTLAESGELPRPELDPSPSVTGEANAAARRASIAVLPFDNLSSDPEQEYFADGMVEEIITGLARIRWLTVIARNSTFAYRPFGNARTSRRPLWERACSRKRGTPCRVSTAPARSTPLPLLRYFIVLQALSASKFASKLAPTISIPSSIIGPMIESSRFANALRCKRHTLMQV